MGFPIEGWMVLPDRPDARRAVAGQASLSRWVWAYASGNPWLISSVHQGEVTLATMGSMRVAVIGSCPVTATRLTDLVARVRTVAELDALARALPGCFHLVASIDGVVRVQGSLTGLRRLRVACGPTVPPRVGERSLWRGVRTLAPDHYLRIDPGGTVASVPWWRPPEPQVPLAAGAGAVRAALEDAVATRRPAQGRLSADLSGGMDSTSLCFQAARAGMPELLTFRARRPSARAQDALAVQAAAGRGDTPDPAREDRQPHHQR